MKLELWHIDIEERYCEEHSNNTMSVRETVIHLTSIRVEAPDGQYMRDDSTASLLNQALFFSSVQAKHYESVGEPSSDTMINPFVKSQNGVDFIFPAVLGPMFHKPDETQYTTPDAVRNAIKNAKNGISSNAIPTMSKPFFIILQYPNSYKGHVETLNTFPNIGSRLSSLTTEFKSRFLLNMDINAFDSDNVSVHPYKLDSVFCDDVWVVLDVSMKV